MSWEMHGVMVDVVILLAKSCVRGQKGCTRSRLFCENVRGLCENDTTNSEFLFAENLVQSTREAKKTSKMSKSSLKDNSSLPRFIKRQYSSAGSKRDSFDNSDSRGSSLCSLNSQGRKKNQQRQSSNKYPLKKFHKY